MIKKYILLFLFVMLSFSVALLEAQNDNEKHLFNYFVSPEANSLGKYGAFPVSLYTGTPQIDIPIYELNTKEFDFKITLNYHASGIKVDQIATQVGLGWSLNAGGVISVDVKGRPDIIPPEIFNGTLSNVPYSRKPSVSFKRYLDRSKDINSILPFDLVLDIVSNNGAYDLEPDVYNYNFCGYSGQFIIDDYNNIQFIRNSDGVKAKYDRINRVFSFTNNMGVRYIFRDKEETHTNKFMWRIGTSGENDYYIFRPDGLTSNSSHYYSAWYLSEIIGPNGIDTIQLKYQPGVERYSTRINSSLSDKIIDYVYDRGGCEKKTSSNAEFIINGAIGYSEQITHKVQNLNKIIYNNNSTEIKFVTSDREDVFGAKKLDKISLYYNVSNLSNWLFGYEYFITDWEKYDSFKDRPYEAIGALHKRLKLKSLQKTDSNNVKSISPYQFNYYGEEVNLKLPYRNCNNGFDHWGFFNESLNSVSDVDNALKSFPIKTSSIGGFQPYANDGIYFHRNSTDNTDYFIEKKSLNFYRINTPFFTLGGDRKPNDEYIKLLSLKEIKTPTGGKIIYDYECNSYTSIWNSTQAGKMGGMRVKRIVEISDTDSIVKEFNYSGGVVFAFPNYLDIKYSPTAYLNGGGLENSFSYVYNNYSNISPYSYGDIIGYPMVNEIIVDSKTNQQIRTVYKYYTPKEYSIGSYQQVGLINNTGNGRINQSNNLCKNNIADRKIISPFTTPVLGKSYRNGLLKSVEKYKASKLVYEELYNYSYEIADSVFANRIEFYNSWPFTGDCLQNSPGNSYSIFHFDIYFHEIGKSFLKNKTIRNFDSDGDGNAIEKKSSYTYNNKYEILLSVEDDLGQETIRKEYEYPITMGSFQYYKGNPHPFQVMNARHMINYPVTEKVLRNERIIDLSVNLYEMSGGNVVMFDQYNLYTQDPKISITPIKKGDAMNLYSIDPRLTKEKSYTYYPNGNIKEIICNKTGEVTTLLWSYKNQYPVVAIRGVSYSNVNGPFGQDILTLQNKTSPSFSDIDLWRNRFTSAHITTYTYRPLVGMTTMTDPRGVTTYYDYDSFGRLKEVYFYENGNQNQKRIVEKYDYHYKP